MRKGKIIGQILGITLVCLMIWTMLGGLAGILQPTGHALATSSISYTVFATRIGHVGDRTANGHVIQTHDHFVALPSTKVLCSNGGHEFEVRITYKGKSVVAPIWDVGPWNTKDDYWNPDDQREIYSALQQYWQTHNSPKAPLPPAWDPAKFPIPPPITHIGQGIPEAQKAYETSAIYSPDSYNYGCDQFGRHRWYTPAPLNPAGIDLANGTFWDDLGMTDNDWVTVEFLWVPAVSVRDSSPHFMKGSNSGHPEYWHTYTYDGTPDGEYNGHAYIWTYVGGMPGNPSEPDCWAEFRPHLSQAGRYDVYACFYADPHNSRYVPHTVYYDGGSTTVIVNQYAPDYFTWRKVKLGTWDFAAGGDTRVVVTDATGEPYDGTTTLNVDTVEFVLIFPINNPPNQPISLSQIRSDGITAIPEGGTTPESTVVFKGTVSDPDGDQVRLEIELRQIDETFTGEPTSETISDFVPSGTEVTVTRYGLVNADYHWQYRAKDSNGATSNWAEFGLSGNIDFTVSLNTPPQLSDGTAEPTSGNTLTDFCYYVTYFDPDGDEPSVKQVYIDGLAYSMSWYSGSDSWITYRYGPKALSAGSHTYYFYFEDGRGGTARLPISGSYSGPTVTIVGDIDGDGDVDSDDFYAFSGTYGTSPPSNPECDLDGDGDVDPDDFYTFARNYGKTV